MGWFVMQEDRISRFPDKLNNNLGFSKKSDHAILLIERFIKQNFSLSEIPIILEEINKKLN